MSADSDPVFELRMSGPNARMIIKNAAVLLRHKFRKLPLWSLVGALTGHGSGYSVQICISANLDPSQVITTKSLIDYQP